MTLSTMTSSASVAAGAPSPAEIAAHMWTTDHASRGLGMELLEVGAGTARMRMTVRAEMLNGFAICHGGFITTLADSAFAFACNSGNEVTVAAGLTVDFLKPVYEGDVLLAEAKEVWRSGRNGIYDMVVTDQEGRRVAFVRGRSARLHGRSVLPVGEPAGSVT